MPSLSAAVEGAAQADPQNAAASRARCLFAVQRARPPRPSVPLRTEAVMTTAAATTPAVALAERDDSELLALIRADDEGDELRTAAREVIVIRYESLVRGCVHRYRDSPEPVEDLMQAGYVGLLKAINNFDPALGQNLAAYAQPCVSGEIKRHFRDKRWQIHVKRSAQELLLQVRRARGELAHDLGRSPRDEEMARHLGVSLDDLHDAQRADMVFHSHSLDAPLYGQEDPATLSELIGQEFFFSSRRRHTRFDCDWSSDVCSSDLVLPVPPRDHLLRAWRLHFQDVRHCLWSGFYHGWDLHPAQLVTRYVAAYGFFRE